MRIKDYLLYAVVLLLYGLGIFFLASVVKANIINNDLSTNFLIEYQTKTQPSAEPKSAPIYPKYASVSFITKKGGVVQDANTSDIDINGGCPSGERWVNGICIDTSECLKNYPLTSASLTAGRFLSADCGSGIRYCYTSCYTSRGWYKSGCLCEPNDCTNYPLETYSSCKADSYGTCVSAGKWNYQCTACEEGYELKNHKCEAKVRPSECQYDKEPSADMGLVMSRKYGEKYCYFYQSCYPGYTMKTTGQCEKITCDPGYKLENNVCVIAYKIGDVYKYNETPIGVVYYINGSEIRITALGDIENGGRTLSDDSCDYEDEWSNDGYFIVDTLSKHPDTAEGKASAIADFEGSVNTRILLAYAQKQGYDDTAMTGASLYTPTPCPEGSYCGKGRWYLPALGELKQIKDNLTNKIQPTLKATDGATEICTGGSYWSSTQGNYIEEDDYGSSWTLPFSGTNTGSFDDQYDSDYVRPSLKINLDNLGKCHQYDLKACPTGATCESCTDGEKTTYRFKSCKDGYTQNGETCVASACEGYPSESASITQCRSTEVCKSGEKNKYKCTDCNNGYTPKDGVCVESGCDGYYDGVTNCKTAITCKKGTKDMYQCSTCDTGYEAVNGVCQKACTFTAARLPEGCEEADSCKKNNITYYDTVCTKCSSFWSGELVNGVCVPTPYPEDYNYNIYTKCANLCTNQDRIASGYGVAAKCYQCASGTMLHTYIDFDGKTATECIRKSDAYYVGGKAVGVIVDPNNHLVLSLRQQEVATQQGNNPYNEALAYCSAMTDGGLSWRLPSGEEFKSMLRLEDEDPNYWNCEDGKNLRAIAMKLKEISGAHKLTGNGSTTGEYVSSDGKGYEFTDNYPRSGFAYDTHQTGLYTGGLPSERGGFNEGHYYARCVANY